MLFLAFVACLLCCLLVAALRVCGLLCFGLRCDCVLLWTVVCSLLLRVAVIVISGWVWIANCEFGLLLIVLLDFMAVYILTYVGFIVW